MKFDCATSVQRILALILVVAKREFDHGKKILVFLEQHERDSVRVLEGLAYLGIRHLLALDDAMDTIAPLQGPVVIIVNPKSASRGLDLNSTGTAMYIIQGCTFD